MSAICFHFPGRRQRLAAGQHAVTGKYIVFGCSGIGYSIAQLYLVKFGDSWFIAISRLDGIDLFFTKPFECARLSLGKNPNFTSREILNLYTRDL